MTLNFTFLSNMKMFTHTLKRSTQCLMADLVCILSKENGFMCEIHDRWFKNSARLPSYLDVNWPDPLPRWNQALLKVTFGERERVYTDFILLSSFAFLV